MMKTIVTHFNPDLDAICAIWLIVRWLAGWQEAKIEFVPAGKTLNETEVDSHPEILHVDTGLGKLDHHQTDKYTCAAKLTLEYIKSQKSRPEDDRPLAAKVKTTTHNSKLKNEFNEHKKELIWDAEALDRLVGVVNEVDHFQEVYYAEPQADYLLLGAEHIFDGWKLLYREEDGLVVEKGLEVLDGIYISFISKIAAEKVLKKQGKEFQTKWGKGIAAETKNNMFDDVAQKIGYRLTVRRHPIEGHIRIKSLPANYLQKKPAGIDLTDLYISLRSADPEADWFLHKSKRMLLNGSAKNPQMKPTKLTLAEVVAIIKSQ